MKRTLQTTICFFASVILATAAPQSVKIYGQTYKMVVPETIPETAVTWAIAKPEVESLLSKRNKQSDLLTALRNTGNALAKKYGEELKKISKQTNQEVDDLAMVFQGNTSGDKWKQTQKLYNTLAGVNHLYDIVLKNPPVPIKTPESAPNNQEEEAEPKKEQPAPKTSVEWGTTPKP